MNQSPLILFLKSVLAFYQSMFRFCVVSIKNFWYVSFISLFIAIAAIYYYSASQKDQFKGTASFTFNYLNKKVYGDRLFSLEQLVENKQFNLLARTLKIKATIARSLVSFQAKNVAGSPLKDDYTEQKYPFYVTVQTTSQQAFHQLESALANFLNAAQFDQTYIRFEHEKLRKKQQIFQADLKRIDSLKELITINDLPNYTEAITLVENISNQLLAIEQQLKKPVSIEVLNEFVPVKTEKSQLVMSFAKKIGLLFIIISVVVSVLFQLNFKDKK
jgi:hypothetical protein